MTGEPKAIKHFIRMVISVALLLCDIALVGFLFAFRDPTIRLWAASAFLVFFVITLMIVIRPLLRWWANPGSDARGAGPLARGIVQAVLAIVRKWGRRCSPLRAQLLYDTGAVLFERCRYRESASKLKEAAALFGEMDDPLNQALALQELGNAENAARNHEEAVRALQQALDLWEHLASNQRAGNTWRLLNNLAVALSDKGSLEDAESYCRRALQVCRQKHGDAHPESATCMVNLADIHRQQLRFQEAEELITQALDILDRSRDENFPFGVGVLAMIHDDRGHFKEAEDLYDRACELLQQQLGADHPEVARLLERHGAMLERSGRKVEGEQMKQHASTILARAGCRPTQAIRP
jgi:tetratricopeptide (TPR) repeat protein